MLSRLVLAIELALVLTGVPALPGLSVASTLISYSGKSYAIKLGSPYCQDVTEQMIFDWSQHI